MIFAYTYRKGTKEQGKRITVVKGTALVEGNNSLSAGIKLANKLDGAGRILSAPKRLNYGTLQSAYVDLWDGSQANLPLVVE